MYSGRSIYIATMHGKEKVISPILENEFGLICEQTKNLNTDIFGTFSGEIEREFSPIETARKKCEIALSMCNGDLAVSSEGSFGPHPVIGFIPCDEEILYWMDTKNGIEIYVKELSTSTNFASQKFKAFKEVKDFAIQCKFPSHGLIVKDEKDSVIAKGIRDWKKLESSFRKAIQKGSFVCIETDMRAHMNPSRMKVIEQCTHKLVKALLTLCPKCSRPGFIQSAYISGLPCQNCSLPTKSSLKKITTCSACHFEEELMYPHQKLAEEPSYCDYCNP